MLKYPSFLSYIAFYQKFPVKTICKKNRDLPTHMGQFSLYQLLYNGSPYSIQFVWNTPSLSTR